MSAAAWVAILNLVLRLAAVVVGFAILIMGYRLFVSGVTKRAGNIEATWGDKRFVLNHAAPGSFLAIAGVIVILAALFTTPRLGSRGSITVIRTPISMEADSAGGLVYRVDSIYDFADTVIASTTVEFDTTFESEFDPAVP